MSAAVTSPASLSLVAPDLWTAEHLMRLPGGVTLPSRMTVVRLPGRDLVLHSPIPLDEVMAGEIDALGQVRHVVAPSLLHHVHLAPCLARYPQADLHAPAGLAKKRPDLRISHTLTDAPAEAWTGVLDQHHLAGAPLAGEVDFFHRPTGTLIAPDLVFNIRAPATFATGLVLRIMGTHKRLAASRMWRRYIKDRDAFAASLDRVLSWDFSRVLPGHGEVVSEDAKAGVTAAVAWLRAVRPRDRPAPVQAV
jgi:hypothetical protein